MKKQRGELFRVLCQKWEESERGWGTRPDGYSLHLSEADRKCFIKEHWGRLPDEVPDEYSRPSGTPYWCEVDEKAKRKVTQSKCGIREFKNSYPGSGGTDGWKPFGSSADGWTPF